MIKQTIAYTDYNDVERREDFYFSLTKLEVMEMEIAFEGGLSAHIEKLVATTDGIEAYHLFKDMILKAYGKKSDDGRHFVKTNPSNGRPYSEEFETSPALAELIFSFLKDGNNAATFVRGLLPSKLVAEVEAEAAKKKSDEAVAASDNSITAVAPEPVEVASDAPAKKKAEDYTEGQLRAMPYDEFKELVGDDPTKMHAAVLPIAFERKAKGA